MSSVEASLVQNPVQQWTIGVVVPRPSATRRPALAGTTNGALIVERVLGKAQLDSVTRGRLTRILMVTVQEWARK